MAEPVHPFKDDKFDRLEGTPWPAPPDHLRLKEAVDVLGKSIAVGIPNAADGWINAGFGKTLGVLYRNVLATGIAVMNKAVRAERPTADKRLRQFRIVG